MTSAQTALESDPHQDHDEPANELRRLKEEHRELTTKYGQLTESSQTLTKRLEHSNRVSNKLAFLVGFFVIAVGAGMMVWTFMLRVKTLNDRAGVLSHGKRVTDVGILSHGEFAAGIAGGCLLIVAVLLAAVLWRQSSDASL